MNDTNENNTINQNYIEKIRLKQEEINKLKKDKNLDLGLGVFFIIIAIIIIFIFKNQLTYFSILSFILYSIIILCCLFGIVGFSMSLDKTAIKYAEQELLFISDEQELNETKNLDIQTKADKQFRLNQRELKRYYDLNLSQTRFLLIFGIILLISGIAIIIFTILLHFFSNNTENLILILGCISGILVDFIGAIFLTIYAKTIETVIRFHSKLADSNNLLLSNSIASKISEESLRNTTLSEISKNIVNVESRE